MNHEKMTTTVMKWFLSFAIISVISLALFGSWEARYKSKQNQETIREAIKAGLVQDEDRYRS